mgnify:CR=1 FL=1
MSEIILSGAEDNKQTSKQTNEQTEYIPVLLQEFQQSFRGKLNHSVSNATGGRIYVKREVSKFGKLYQLNDPYLSAKVFISLSVKACVHWFIP